jgi:hypothetical protein
MVKSGGKTTKERIEKNILSSISARPPVMSKNLIVRVTEEMHDKLAELADEMSKELPGRKATISDVARGILDYGLWERRLRYGAWAYRDDTKGESEEGI